MNRKWTKENASPKKFIQDAKSKDFTREHAQAFTSYNTNFNAIN